jgi:hypothetical protein
VLVSELVEVGRRRIGEGRSRHDGMKALAATHVLTLGPLRPGMIDLALAVSILAPAARTKQTRGTPDS